jgi:hypothetical protein
MAKTKQSRKVRLTLLKPWGLEVPGAEIRVNKPIAEQLLRRQVAERVRRG